MTMHSFDQDLRWSLSPANTSTAVRMLSASWPARHWVLCCNTTDRAGCDLLGFREDRQPIRVDLKVRRGIPADPPDCIFDLQYQVGAEKRPAPVLRPEPLPVDYLLHLWPDADPQVGALVEARRSQLWLQEYHTALRHYTTTSNRSSGSEWSTVFVAPSVELMNSVVGDRVVRVLTVSRST